MNMLTSIFDFKNQKDIVRVVLFYIGYLILLYLLITVFKSMSSIFIKLMSVLFSAVLSFVVIQQRKLAMTPLYFFLIELSGILSYFYPFLGLLVTAYLTTTTPERPLMRRLSERFIPLYNKVFRRRLPHPVAINFSEAAEVFAQQDSKSNDISDHLSDLFFESLMSNPKLIVELGVRTGESTKCLEKVAKICDATLIQVDPDPESYRSEWKKSYFVAEDDIKFAKRFKRFCEEKRIAPTIDLLFIDTTHLYQQTVDEIREWFPLLAPNARVMFHDTAMAVVSKRNDGTYNQGWDNNRGVIAPIEEYLGMKFDEKKDFVAMVNKWLVIHRANCSGFTTMQRIV